MNRRQKAIIPALPITWFLEHTFWRTIGYSLGDDKRVPFAITFYLLGLGPLLLVSIAGKLTSRVGTALAAYSNYHLMFILLLFFATLPIFLLHSAIQSFNSKLLLYPWLRPALALGALLLCARLFAHFFHTASHPVLTQIELSLAKPGPADGIRLLAISDIHYETLRDRRVIQRAADLIRSRQPDVLLILGDSVTNDAESFIADEIPGIFAAIPTRYGHYVITGNHDFYVDNVDELLTAYSQAGFRVLRDEVVHIGDSLWLVGREDRGGMRGMRKRERADLAELLEQTDSTQVVIVLDHQPQDLATNAALGIDLQLSGHTHGGQIWPVTYITKRLFDLNYGLKKIDKSYFFVTSGLGYWGPPLRIGTKCEVLEIELSFTGNPDNPLAK